ncbi:MAG: hypothetical protein Q8R00_00280 [Candidatus Nanoarchaeia archaeon]|nr:hypothetical protein [Candidatus Nanoarchaeia archaeon]
MTEKRFKDFEGTLRKWAHEAIVKEWSSGFNYYPDSIELNLGDSISIPVKCGHREERFLAGLEGQVSARYDSSVTSQRIPRMVVYEYKKIKHPDYEFTVEDGVRIFDVDCNKILYTQEDFDKSSPNLLAEGEEQSLVFLTDDSTIIDLARFIIRKANHYMIDASGEFVHDEKGAVKINEDMIPGAYRAPMIIATHTPNLERALPEFAPVKKLFRIVQDNGEISTYLDEKYETFIKNCRIKFDNEVLRLANKAFRNVINFKPITKV